MFKKSSKKNIVIILSLLFLNYIFHWFNSTPQTQWVSYRHQKKGVTKKVPSVAQLKKVNLFKEEKRGPSSLSEFPQLDGRYVLGEDLIPKKEWPPISQFLNQKSEDWKEKAASTILRFHDDDTELFIEHKESLIFLEKKGARYVEKVVLTFINEQGKRNGYSALIDGQSGQVLQTWGSDINENFGKNR